MGFREEFRGARGFSPGGRLGTPSLGAPFAPAPGGGSPPRPPPPGPNFGGGGKGPLPWGPPGTRGGSFLG
eukprot:UN3145